MQPDIVLDEYNPKLLADAKLKGDVFRERDLKGHMLNPDGEDSASSSDEPKVTRAEYKKEELQSITKSSKSKNKGKDSDKSTSADDDDMAPTKVNPKEDYQVHEALNYLKSFDVFKKISGGDSTVPPGATAKSE